MLGLSWELWDWAGEAECRSHVNTAFWRQNPPAPPVGGVCSMELLPDFEPAQGKKDKELSLKSPRDRTFRAEDNRDLSDSPLKAQEVGRLTDSVCRARNA